MKKYIAIFIGKIVSFVGSLVGRGSNLPGAIALKIDKNLIKKIKLPEVSIVVTGSSGKTSTSFTIAHILEDNGYTVAHNKEGSNLKEGLATLLIRNASLSGKFNKDAFVMEMDERYTKSLIPLIKPKFLVICNITRDQPPRQGHFDYVFDIINASISKDMHIVLNADDPLDSKFALSHTGKVSYFGMCKTEESFDKLTSNSLDMVYCPKCNHKLIYDYVSFSNVGKYQCDNCSFKRPELDFEITDVSNGVITINDEYKFKSKTDQLYTYYNYISAFSICSLLGIDGHDIVNSMENINFFEKRYSYFEIENREGYILSGKNENAPSYNQAFNYVGRKEDLKTIIFGFEYISLRYPYEDLSWLYDIDFELIENKTIDTFICIGPFAYDIAVRAYLAGVDKEKIKIVNRVDEVYPLLSETKGNIYAILNLGTDKKLINELTKNNIDVK